jgi:4-hydroxy-3-polyprenylbenzoate decarboxylase
MRHYNATRSACIRDFRDYVDRLEREGELQKISAEVQPVFEVGAVIRRSHELRSPAPFFTQLRGFPGHRLLGSPLGLGRDRNRPFARFAIALAMRPESTAMEIIEKYLRLGAQSIEPVMVDDGPCKENILLGDAVDLQMFPAPVLNRGDGGPSLGAWHVTIVKDPEGGAPLWGRSRLTIHNRNILGGPFLPEHGAAAEYYAKYESRGRPMEFAVAVGTEPATPCLAGARFPCGRSAAEIAGAIRGAPLELVRCETVDLEVPAHAEIIIEGFVPPGERKDEGPFGERGGFLAGARAARPVYHVTAITHRNDPILPVAVDDLAVPLCLTNAADILAESRRRGFPVRSVYCPPEALAQWSVISTGALPYPGYARYLAQTIWGAGAGRSTKYAVIVDEDVDPTDMGQVVRAISTRCDPKRGLLKAQNFNEHRPLSAREAGAENAYALFDCTAPREWSRESAPPGDSADDELPKEIAAKIAGNWRAYGYLEEGLDE